MTTPTLFSDVAANAFQAKREPQGVIAQKFSLTLPVSTAAGTNCGLIRFEKGFSLVGLSLKASDMDTATTLVLDVGYIYDSASFTDDDNAFFDDTAIGQTGTSVVWPIAGGLLTGVSFTAEGDGYLSLTTRGESIEVAGTVEGIALFTYDM